TYEIRVFPFDRNSDGVADYRLYNRCLGTIDVNDDGSGDNAGNLTNLALVLEDETGVIVGSSFQDLSTEDEGGYGSDGYPISAGTLIGGSPFLAGVSCINCGLAGTLVGPNAPIWLHFGAVVNESMASFELV